MAVMTMMSYLNTHMSVDYQDQNFSKKYLCCKHHSLRDVRFLWRCRYVGFIWVMLLCSLLGGYQSFGGIILPQTTLKMEVIHSSKTVVSPTRLHGITTNPKDCSPLHFVSLSDSRMNMNLCLMHHCMRCTSKAEPLLQIYRNE
jgi:hypothetical protein